MGCAHNSVSSADRAVLEPQRLPRHSSSSTTRDGAGKKGNDGCADVEVQCQKLAGPRTAGNPTWRSSRPSLPTSECTKGSQARVSPDSVPSPACSSGRSETADTASTRPGTGSCVEDDIEELEVVHLGVGNNGSSEKPPNAAVAPPVTTGATPSISASARANLVLPRAPPTTDSTEHILAPTPAHALASNQLLDDYSFLEAAAAGSGNESFLGGPWPPCLEAAPVPPSPAQRVTLPVSWPEVEITFATRALVLTWARYGRNSLRIKNEERIKALQHKEYPKLRRRPRTPVLSPQPTPRNSATVAADGAATTLSMTGSRPSGACTFTGRAGGSMLSRDGSRPGSRPPSGLLFDELKQDQRDSMNAQGTKLKLSQKLGPGAAQANSEGTPGFGLETPSFPGAKSRTSKEASAMSSVMSSGRSSPLARGQMSPWILEAEALVNGEEDAVNWSPTAWGVKSAFLEEIPEVPATAAPAPCLEELLADELLPIEDGDELDMVKMFVDSGELEKGSACAPLPGYTKNPVNSIKPTPMPVGTGDMNNDNVDSVATAAPTTTGGSCAMIPLGLDAGVAEPQYVVGEVVSYWSASRSTWMKARVVERRSRSVYVIDKQMRGCLSKVNANELISEAEERNDPLLRACAALGDEDDEDNGTGGNTGSSGSVPVATAGTGAASGTQAAWASGTVLATKPQGGRVVRDDFSSDSSENDEVPGSGRGHEGAPSGQGARVAVPRPRTRPAAAVSPPAVACPGHRSRSPKIGASASSVRLGAALGRASLPPASPPMRANGASSSAASPPTRARGCIVRDDFSDDDSD